MTGGGVTRKKVFRKCSTESTESDTESTESDTESTESDTESNKTEKVDLSR